VEDGPVSIWPAGFASREIGYDRTFAAEIVTNLQDHGLELVQFGQGFLSLAAPTGELERLVISRALWHGGHPVLRWNASNVAVRQDPAGNIKPDKSGRESGSTAYQRW
jgi:phage terminase large subunit-like protein